LIEVDILELVMARKKGLKKRVWSDDEKRTICAQALTADVSAAQVARRYAAIIEFAFRLPGRG
jgi:transposase